MSQGLCFLKIRLKNIFHKVNVLGAVVLRHEHQTPDSEIAGSNPTKGESLRCLSTFHTFGASTGLNQGSIHREGLI